MKKLLQLSLLSTGIAFGLIAPGTALAQGACSVNFQTENNWGAGAQYKVTLTNTGAAKTSWELCWTYAGSDTVSQLWEGSYTQTGKNVCVKNVGYNGNLATNGSVAFGLIATNPGTSPTEFTLNGAACGGTTTSASSSSTSSVTTTASSKSSSSAPAVAARWLLDGTASTLHFVTVKKSTAGVETPENMTFTQLQGTVANNGQATLSIPLASISTGVDIRNTRMQSLLFESGYLPSLHFTTQLDLAAIDAMAVGSTSVQSLTGNLVLHAIVKPVAFDALIVKHANNRVSFSPRKPIAINSTDFDMNAGVEALRAVAGLSTISEKVPVYFKMFLTRDNPTNTPAIALASAPNAALGLSGSMSNTTGVASLNWVDASSNESGFLVRRKGADGRWATATGTAANTVSYLDSLTVAGGYDYKVISYTDSIPAVATAPISLTFEPTTGSSASSASSTSVTSTSASSKSSASLSSGSSSSVGPGNSARGEIVWREQCAGCHGTRMTVSLTKYPENSTALQTYIAGNMPASNPSACVGQCAADAAALIIAWTKSPSGQPVNDANAFACTSTGTQPGKRTLRLLTRAEYQRSVGDLVGYTDDVISRLPDDAISGAFQNNNDLFVDAGRYSNYVATAERIAESVATRWNSVLACTPSTACADKLVSDLAPRIFRRPLTATEQTSYQALARGTTGSRTVAEGMTVALATMLSAPQYLYRSEVGDLTSGTTYKLNGYEMATYLSYTFTGTTPNATLMAAAANGNLNTVAGVRQQAATLLNSATTKVLMGQLVNRWLGTETLPTQAKVGVANFATLANDMKAELSKNFSAAMLEPSSTFATLYNPTFTHVNQRLASHYGLAYSGTADADGFVRVNTSDRGGILTSGAFMSRYARDNDANLVTRAVAVRRKMMCQDIPEPPSGTSLDRDALGEAHAAFLAAPTTTERMAIGKITENQPCSNCHLEIINPLGGGMENFDATGRVRTTDLRGNAINAQATFFSPYQKLQFANDPNRVIYSPEISFNGAKDLARLMVEQPLVSQQAKTCLATQLVSFSSGVATTFLIDRDETREVPYDMSLEERSAYRCNIEKLTNVLNASGPRAMLQEIPALDSVIYRQEWAR